MDQLLMDIRYSVRSLRRSPAFTAVALLVLALGIGATTAIFSVVNAVLIRPLPYRDPARLAAVSSLVGQGGASRTFPTVSLNEVEQWRAAARSLDSIGSFVFSAVPATVGPRTMFLVAIGADPELFETLGVQAAMGRNLAGHGSSTKDSGVLISHRLWLEAFGGDTQVLGRQLVLDGAPNTVLGVLPASFQFPRSDASYFSEAPDVFFPVANIADSWGRDSTQWFSIARLKPGVTLSAADAELKTITAGMASQSAAMHGMSVRLSGLAGETTAGVRRALLLTLGISAVLLLIACSNIMNLLFSRAAQRGREMAVRKAVGASTWALVRQMLVESFCLTFFSGIAGVALARLALDALVRFSPAHLPVSGRVDIDWTVLAFALAVCSATAVLAALAPAIHRGRQNEISIASTRTSASRAVLHFQRVLMIAQIALGVGLLAVAGLLSHNLYLLNSLDPGFRTSDTLAFEVAFPSGRPKDTPQVYRRILDVTRGLPGVISAGWITNPPPETRAGVFIPFSIPGANSRGQRFCNFQVTSEDYFRTAGIPFSRGRDFTAMDSSEAPGVVIVNETLARTYFPNVNPVGQHMAISWEGQNAREIVGVIRDIHDRGLTARTVAAAYVPYEQFTLAYGGVVARTGPAPGSVLRELQRRIAAIDPPVALRSLNTVAARLSNTLDAPRFYTTMSAVCALMAVLFVTLGLYGVISYSVSRRTSEIGIRMALGASRESIRRAVLVQGLGMAVAGVVLGVVLSLAATRLLASLLFEVKPVDPPTLAISAAIVVVVTLCAAYVPARRASMVPPMAALRHD